jgi:hypothetical protein
MHDYCIQILIEKLSELLEFSGLADWIEEFLAGIHGNDLAVL